MLENFPKNFSSIRGDGGRRREDELGEVQREIPKILHIDFKNDFKH